MKILLISLMLMSSSLSSLDYNFLENGWKTLEDKVDGGNRVVSYTKQTSEGRLSIVQNVTIRMDDRGYFVSHNALLLGDDGIHGDMTVAYDKSGQYLQRITSVPGKRFAEYGRLSTVNKVEYAEAEYICFRFPDTDKERIYLIRKNGIFEYVPGFVTRDRKSEF